MQMLPCSVCHYIHIEPPTHSFLSKEEKAYNNAVDEAKKASKKLFNDSIALAYEIYTRAVNAKSSSAPAKE